MKNKDIIMALCNTHELGTVIDTERLGGLTNLNHRVTTSNGDYVIRIAGHETNKIINRNHEIEIIQAIEHTGIDAPLIVFEPESGLKISKYLEGAQTMNAALLNEEENIIKVAQLFKTLHGIEEPVDVPFEILDMVEKYEDALHEANGFFPENYDDIRNQIFEIQKNNPDLSPKVLSHNDPLPENFILDKDKRLYLVDWEYGGMNSRYWDLADVSIEADYDHNQDTLLLKEYLGHNPVETDWIHFNANKLFIDLLWSLWGFVRDTIKTPEDTEDFIEYGMNRFERLEKLLETMSESNT